MPLSSADLLAEDVLAAWLVENSPVKLQIARVWPFLGVAGGSLKYARSMFALSPALQVADCTGIGENSETAEEVEFKILDFMTRYSICFADQDRYRHPNNLDATEYALSVRKLLYAYFAFLDDTANPASLWNIMAPSRRVNMGGGPLTLDCLNHAFNLVVENDGRPTVIMASTRGLRSYQSLCYAAGYEPPKVAFNWYNPAKGRMEQGWAPAFNGVPILVNDQMVSASLSTPGQQRIWFLALGDDSKSGPTRGVSGIVPEALKGSMFVKRETNGIADTTGGGLEPQTAIDVWVSWPVGLATGSQGAISVIHNFAPVSDCEIA